MSLTSTAAKITSAASAGPSDPTSADLVAIVTDSAGLDTIAGGTLTDASHATYGAFGAGAQKGTYTATVDWATATQAVPLDFGAGGTTRSLTATFFDNDGNMATASIDLGFFCNPTATSGACGGVCTDFTASASCGGCGNACGEHAACLDEACQPAQLTACEKHDGSTTCSDICGELGQSCAVACTITVPGLQPYIGAGLYDEIDTTCDFQSGLSYGLNTCDATFEASAGSVECCCAS
ncbi:MAG TPA: hypothetical protein VLX92_15710 [Kofleriaceae bacterium]|nr:hypothetical protein [Kofleriaceae bacterium]